MPTDGESLLLRRDLDHRDSEASTNDTVSEQSNEVNTFIDTCQDKEFRTSVARDYDDDISPPPLPPEPTLCTMNIPCIHSSIPNDGEILSLPLVSSVYRLEQSDDIDNAKSSPESENSIRDLNGIKEEYLTEYDTSSHGNNYYDNEYGVFCNRIDVDTPPPLSPESLDDDVWNLERYRFNDNNNNFNYDDIDREILRFKYEDSFEKYETIVFHDCDNNVDATQPEETLKKYRVDNNNIYYTELDHNASVFQLVIQALLVMSQLLFRSICRAVAMILEIGRSDHSESIESNPSKIPNDGERIVLLSLVSRGVILNRMSAVNN